MGLFDTIKKTIKENLPDVVTNNDISGQSNQMLYKYDKITLSTGSRLIVGPSQQAIFVENGVIQHVFDSGAYDLETLNIPFVKQLLTKLYGGTSPNQSEIWFVNKSVVMDISWGTPSPLVMEERKFGPPLTIKVRCNGSISVKTTDAVKLFKEIAGQGKQFTVDTFKDLMRSMMISRLQKVLGEYMMQSDGGFVALQQRVSVVEEPIRELIEKELENYGVSVQACYIKSFTPVEDDSWDRYKKYEDEYFQIHKDATRIKAIGAAETTAQSQKFQTLGVSYADERKFDLLDKVADNPGDMSGGMSLGVGLAMGKSLGTEVGNIAADVISAPPISTTPITNSEELKNCPSCSGEYKLGAKFCPECGYTLKIICSECANELTENMKFCPECGKKPKICKKCGIDNASEAEVCKKCNSAFVEIKKCASCGFTPDKPMKFCPECGSGI